MFKVSNLDNMSLAQLLISIQSLFCIVILSITPMAYGAKAKSDDTTFVIAKKLLLEGKRREAVLLLSKTSQMTKNFQAKKEYEIKRSILAEQFITTENFQRYQNSKAYSSEELWADCLKVLSEISTPDQDNLQVLRIKSICEIHHGQSVLAERTLAEIFDINPGDPIALIGFATLALQRKEYSAGLKYLDDLRNIPIKQIPDVEKLAILKSRLLEESGKISESIDVLLADQEKYLNHLETIYRLSELYNRHAGYDWQARKFYSLFITRCKRLNPTELAKRKLEAMHVEAQKQLASLDKKLSVDFTQFNNEQR